MSVKYTTKIEHGTWKHGDVVVFPVNTHKGMPVWDIICEVNGDVLLEFPDKTPIVPQKEWECIRIDYRFISDGTWYVKDSEAFPTHAVDSEENMWGAVFKGWTNETYDGCEESLPRWDGELCSLSEFQISKR